MSLGEMEDIKHFLLVLAGGVKKKRSLIVLDSGVEVVYDYLSDGTSVQER